MHVVRHFAYLGMLAFCLLGTAGLELLLGVRVYRRWRRLLLTLAPVVAVFVAWDLYAISRRQWKFDPAQTVGVVLPGGLPLEELLFFVVVPVCAVLTLEAVRVVRGWPVGDGAVDVRRRPVLGRRPTRGEGGRSGGSGATSGRRTASGRGTGPGPEDGA